VKCDVHSDETWINDSQFSDLSLSLSLSLFLSFLPPSTSAVAEAGDLTGAR